MNFRMIFWILVVNVYAEMDLTRPIIMEEEGLVFQPKGLVALNEEYIQLSLMMKVKQPKILSYQDRCSKLCTLEEIQASVIKCAMNFRTQTDPTPSGTLLEAIKDCKSRKNCVIIHKDAKDQLYYISTDASANATDSNTTFQGAEKVCIEKETWKTYSCQVTEPESLGTVLTDNLKDDLVTFWNNAKTQFNEIVEVDGYSPNKKNKRQVAAVLGIGALLTGIVTTGFNFFQNKQLRAKVDAMREDFKDFVQETHDVEHSLIDTNKEIIKIVQNLDAKLEQEYNRVSCVEESLTLSLLQSQEAERFKNRVREIVKPIGEGKRTTPFTPNLLNISIIEDLVSKHPLLNDSIYREHPSLVYTTSTVTLAQASKAKDNSPVSVHLVLNVPIIRSKNVYHFYQVEQTGISQNEKCWKLDIPKNVYVKPTSDGRQIFSLDDIPCDKSDDNLFRLCSVEDYIEGRQEKKSFLEVSCLNGNLTNCQLTKYPCKETSVYTTHGLLTRSDNELRGVNRIPQEGRTITVWKPDDSPRRTKYWSWSKFESVDMTEGYVSCNDYKQEVSFVEITTQEVWQRVLKAAEIKYDRENVSLAIEKLNQSLSSIDEDRKWFNGGESDFTLEIVVAGLVGLCIMAISILIVYCMCNNCKRKFLKPYQPVKNETEMVNLRRGSKTSTRSAEYSNEEKSEADKSPRKRKVRVIENSDDEILQDAVPEQPIMRSPSKTKKPIQNKGFRYSTLYGPTSSE